VSAREEAQAEERVAAAEGRLYRHLAATVSPGDARMVSELDLIRYNARLESRVAGLEEWVRFCLLMFGGRGFETQFLAQQEARIKGEELP
jgi:hypothetical protein